MPGGTADEPYPPGPPVIAYSSAGGFADLDRGGFFAFEEDLRARMSECCDCGESIVDVRRGNQVVRGMQVCNEPAKAASLAFQKTAELVGPNPCQ